MTSTIQTLLGLIIPFAGTTLGAAMVFLLKKEMSSRLQKALLGFASGVMIAASVWSLLIPAIDMAESHGQIAWIPAVVGFLIGIGFLLLLDTIIPHLHIDSDKPEGKHAFLKKSTMLILAVTLHNIPEGMAVGVVFAGMLAGNSTITVASAFALAIGIAIQNFPEGAIISMPVVSTGVSKPKAFFIRRFVGNCRANRCHSYNFAYFTDHTDFTVYPVVCCRSNDLCRSGGINPGITIR